MPTHPFDSPATDPAPARRPLEVIYVRTQCTKDWNEMTGDSQTRYCPHCQKDVHNLSAMYAGDAERVICESAGRVSSAIAPATQPAKGAASDGDKVDP
jgi:hypothetical protein